MHGIKLFSSVALSLVFLPALATQTLTCMSENNAFQRCGLSNADQRDIRIKGVKAGNCDANNAWGVDSSAIWVDKGCGAVFEYTQTASAGGSSNDNTDTGGSNIYIAPDFVGPYYGPGFYYGAGFYQSNNWNQNDYCNGHDCNHNQQHDNGNNNFQHNQEFDRGDEMSHDLGGFHGGGGHGGGGRR